MHDRLLRLFPYFLLSLCALPFLPGINGPFLLDDISNLMSARAPSGTWPEIFDATFRNTSGYFRRPIANLSFVANYHWIGPTPFAYKAVNLVLHLLVAVAIWRLAARLLGMLYPGMTTQQARTSGLVAAAMWTVHPLQVSTVLYVVQRMTQLSALFMVMALLVCLRTLQDNKGTLSRKPALIAAIGFWALALLAILSKENGVLAPALVLATWLSLPLESRRLFTADRGRNTLFALTGWLPVIAGMALGLFLLDWIAGGYIAREFTLVERMLTQPFVLAHYLHTIVIPDYRLMGLYLDDIPIRDASDRVAWLVLAITLALPLLALALRKRAPALCFAVLWFYACHALESTIFPLEMAFEHRNYLALLGPALAASHYLCRATIQAPLPSLRLLLAIPFVVLAASTMLRAQQWSSLPRFTVAEVEHHPGSPRAQNAAAGFDAEKGDIPSVLARIKKVQALHPNVYWTWSLDMSVACGVPNHPVQWQTMLEMIEKKPRAIVTTDMMRLVAMQIEQGRCPFLSPIALDEHVAKVAKIFERENMPEKLEKALVVRSYLARAAKDETHYRALLKQAIDANPGGTLALSDLAYHELNAGNLDAADAAITQMQVRIGDGREQHKVDELSAFLRQARDEAKAAAATTPQP